METIKPLLKIPGVISRKVALPTATATELDVEAIDELDLTFAMNFKADSATKAQLLAYGNWYADYVLTVNKDVTYNANGTKDGYLAGQYDSWSPAWVAVPNKDVTVAAGKPVKIMETAAETYGKAGLKYTYGEVYDRVKDFDCGVFFTDEFLAANLDVSVTLELRIYNPLNEDESYLIGEKYSFVASQEGTKLTTEASVLAAKNVTAEVPAGVLLADGANTLSLSLTNLEESQSGIEANENQKVSAMDVHVAGVSEENTTPIIITVAEATEPGYNKGNLSLFHVEDGVAVEMEEVETKADLVKHNQFTYDPTDGTIVLAMANFSEVAMVADVENVWNGGVDFSWYTKEAASYTIANADQFVAFGQIVGGMAEGVEQDDFNGKTVTLLSNLNFGGEENVEAGNIFYPIGYYNNLKSYEKVSGVTVSSNVSSFEGVFDGNGNVIENIYQNTWSMFGDYNSGYSGTPNHYKDAMGIFGYVVDGTVKNLTVKNFASDGEFTPTGVIAAYAKNSNFENIALTNCNPRVYNTGNGGIVGIGGNESDPETDRLTFTNITIDNSNKITALWGSWDVACGGLIGMFRGAGHVDMTNCHVAAQIDVYNDVCGNYQYYWYRYAGMMIGTNFTMITDEDGYTVPETSKFHAEGCTVHFGDWNDYYYCELVANSLASYTHDHQFSRLTQIQSVSEIQDENGNWTTTGNFIVMNGKTPTDTCYHIINKDGVLTQHHHEDAGTEVVNNETVLKENNQRIYLPFNQLFTGYGWGVKNIPVYNGEDYAFEGITILDREFADSVVKFESVAKSTYGSGAIVTVGDLFKAIENVDVEIDADNVQVTVSPADQNSTVSATYVKDSKDWTKGTVTFAGSGKAIVTITDYYFCTATTIELSIVSFETTTTVKNKNISMDAELVDERVVISCTNEGNMVENISIVVTLNNQIVHIDQADKLTVDGVYYSNFKPQNGMTYYIKATNGHSDLVSMTAIVK